MRPWRKYVSVAVLVLLTAVLVIGTIVAFKAVPIAKRELIAALGNQFKSDIQISSIRVIPGRTFYITANGVVLTKHDRPGFPPLIKAAKIEAEIRLLNMLRLPIHVSRVRITGLEIRVPPRHLPQDAQTQPQPTEPAKAAGAHLHKPAAFLIDEIDTPGASMEMIPRKAGKIPLEFSVENLKMFNVGLNSPARYHAVLTNPKPVGDIVADGTFGPWNGDEPAATPVSGAYTFTHVDMATIHGLGGTLSSQGQFAGELDNIHATGHTDTPDFQLRMAGNPMPLQTDFDATVDGATGDVILNHVKARLGNSKFDVTGAIVGNPAAHGHTITVNATAVGARLQDFIRLAVPGNRPLMTGGLSMHTKILLPPGEEDITDKLNLDGSFDIGGAHFTEEKVQEKVDTLSRKGSGRPQDFDIGNVLSNLRGNFRLAGGMMTFSSLTFNVPGAHVSLNGTYKLKGGALNFTGKLRLDAKLSQTMTGFKSILLKPFNQLFSKNGAGTEVPIKITGTRDHASFGLDFHNNANK